MEPSNARRCLRKLWDGVLDWGTLMPRQDFPYFLRDVVNQTLAGESVLPWFQVTSVPERLLHGGKHQALVDQGLIDGVNFAESVQLRAANKGIKAGEKELQFVKDASELFDGQPVVPPKDFGSQPKVL